MIPEQAGTAKHNMDTPTKETMIVYMMALNLKTCVHPVTIMPLTN